MAEPNPVISEILGHCPDELASYYASDQLEADIKERAHLLDLNAASEYTKMLIGIPIARRLGLWALNDANDSNPYCYISNGPCAGAVMLFSHDPEPEIRFSSLANFISSISEVDDLENIRPEPGLSFDLDSEITSLLEEDTDDSAFLLATYLTRAGRLSASNLNTLGGHPDFLLREAFAWFLQNHGGQDELEIATKLSQDSSPQVARAAKGAVAAIRIRMGEQYPKGPSAFPKVTTNFS
jgi:hypothetical protein